ncbi:MAG: hypothetical protein LBT51_02725 [Fusobacteriaceae bacterium]|jgi:hypothetical protein|nr:hypothetical protein [Fusobacteriaceae bacterium]
MKKIDKFIVVATMLVYGIGLYSIYVGKLNIYYIGGLFSIIALFKALTEKNFNPGNYLFYCIVVLMGGILIESFLKMLIYRGFNFPIVIIIFLISLSILSLISAYFYNYTMEKGKKDTQEDKK